MKRLVAIAAVFLAAACGDDRLTGTEDPKSPTGEPECHSTFDCGDGERCQSGVCVCVDASCDGSGGGGGQDDPEGQEPGGGDPGGGTPGGGTPGGGAPGGGTNELPPYIGGQWKTDHHFDWSDYLGPLAGLGEPLDAIDQIFLGSSQILSLPIAGPIIQDIVESYIPPWVADLVHLLNGLVHFFQDVRMTGVMSVQHQNGDPFQVTATEVWEWGYVSIIDGCPLGESDPGYPACAQVAVPLNMFVASFGTIQARPKPFAGTIARDTTGAYEVRFGQRRVELEVGRFLKFVLDRATEMATNGAHDELGQALASLVDCEAIAADLHAFLCNNFNACSQELTLEQGCLYAVQTGVAAFNEQLLQVTVDWDAMVFDERARITYSAQTGNATHLGTLPGDPGRIEHGDFELLMGADLDGTWAATRP